MWEISFPRLSIVSDHRTPQEKRSSHIFPKGIGCAGEIKISEHEDYDKWAIDILVKFRDSEKLQLLTGERQSGGVSCDLLDASRCLTSDIRNAL